MKRRSEVRDRRSAQLPLLAALWVKAVLAPLEVLQRKEFQQIARKTRAHHPEEK